MAAAAERAGGTVPVSDGEGDLDLCPRLRVPSEEAGKEQVGLWREGVDGKLPA